MITGRKIQKIEDLEKVKELLKLNNLSTDIQEDDILFALEDNNNIIGVCNVKEYYNEGIIKYLVISEEYRGQKLGDGLLRSTLNYCLRNGIDRVYYPGMNQFFVNMGFETISKNQVKSSVVKDVSDNKILKCNIEEFFSRGCKCKGRE